MTTLEFLLKRYDIGPIGRKQPMPIEVSNTGRDQLAGIFAELGFREGVEIGVMEGEYSEVLCKANPGLHLTSVDPWLVREEYHDIRRPQPVFDAYERTARARLAPYNCTILKMKSTEAAPLFKDGSLDFVYIDGHHDFLPVAEDIVKWTPKVRKDGIIAGHDYAKFKPWASGHVFEVVNAWTDAKRIRPWFVLGLRSAPPGQIRDRHRSFVWVKE